MPSTSERHRSRWPDGDWEAMNYLHGKGWRSDKKWEWHPPAKVGYECSAKELDAVLYLILEWDWGGVAKGYRVKYPPKKERLPI